MHFDMWTGRRSRRPHVGEDVQVFGELKQAADAPDPHARRLNGIADDHRAIITDAIYVISVDDGRSRASRVRWFVARLAAFVAVALGVAVLSLPGGSGHQRRRVRARVAVPVVATQLGGWREVNRANSVRVAREIREHDRHAGERAGR